ncbi:hypothetical protein Vadar_000535 [Vaccinium darrowii]|uniref:Uncharacterized protein n=1 Tax=Vaccinium darrowii TaxID=229202 RepID=A0ACB7XMA7_9ERIC|nr:hypothetical protein Vadar_000535 [Vaccinium darrowii]
MASQQFLWRLRYELKLPVLCLVDCDPYGIRIMATYKYGAKNMAANNYKIVIRDMKWLGILPNDLKKFGILKDVALPTSEDALGQIKNLSEEPFVKNDDKMIAEVTNLLSRGKTPEIDCIGGSNINA